MHPNTPSLSSPSAGDICKPLDVVGHLLLIRPVEFLPEFATSNGLRDAVRIDIADLSANDDQGQWGAVYRDALWFGRVLVAGLRRQIGEIVLGRMAQGVAKPGQNPPFNLVDMIPDPQAVAAAQSWLALHPEFANGSATSTPTTTPQPAPVVAPPPAPYPPTPPQPQYVPGPVPAYGPPQPPPQGYGPVPPAPVPPPPAHINPQQQAPYQWPTGAVPVAPPAAPPASAPPAATAPVDPNADPYTLLSPEQRAALEAIGFRRA